jgi:hypothetical protein
MKSVKMMMSENQLSQSQVQVAAFQVLRVKHQKASLIDDPVKKLRQELTLLIHQVISR